MISLTRHLEKYLELRHRLGFKLRGATFELRNFVRFAQQAKTAFITTKLALDWATQPTGCQPTRYGNRLSMVRGFAEYLSAMDPRTEVPPTGLLPDGYHRKTPYFYRDSEICRLVETVRKLPSPQDLRAVSQATLFGLLAVTGMRVGEAIALDRKDVDLQQGLITVRQAKFGKSRLVPVHVTTRKQLQAYARVRDRICPRPSTASFFLSERGTRLTHGTVRRWFVIASHRIGLRGPADRRGPRIHDLRHRFASRALLNMYQRGLDVEAHLPALTTYLGHGHVADTYWYISATPELLRLATERLERKGEALA
jgi:site-specific recombinase XerD